MLKRNGNYTHVYNSLIFHCVIDYGKCDGWYEFKADQALHLLCKLFWILYLLVYVK